MTSEEAPERGNDEPEDEGSRDTAPPLPADDDESPLGDTDQHSDANA